MGNALHFGNSLAFSTSTSCKGRCEFGTASAVRRRMNQVRVYADMLGQRLSLIEPASSLAPLLDLEVLHSLGRCRVQNVVELELAWVTNVLGCVAWKDVKHANMRHRTTNHMGFMMANVVDSANKCFKPRI